MSFKVRATEILFYGLSRQRPESEFTIHDLIEFSPTSMEFVNDADHEKYLAALDSIVERKKAIKQAAVEAPLEPVVMKRAKPAAPKPLHEKSSSKKKSDVI